MLRLQTNTALSLRPPSRVSRVQVVQPGVWPGVSRGTRLIPPRVTASPSRRMRSALTGGNVMLSPSTGSPLPPRASCTRVGFAGEELRAGPLPQRGEAAGVVGVGLAVDEELDVLQLEAELPDAVADEGRGLHEAAVDHDVPRGRGDQERRDIARPDVIEVVRDPERLDRLVPRAGGRVGLGQDGQGGREEQEESEKGVADHGGQDIKGHPDQSASRPARRSLSRWARICRSASGQACCGTSS